MFKVRGSSIFYFHVFYYLGLIIVVLPCRLQQTSSLAWGPRHWRIHTGDDRAAQEEKYIF